MKNNAVKEEIVTRAERTTYDARLQYYDVLKTLMIAISKARVYGDERARLNAIDELYTFVSPFITNAEEQTQIEDDLERAGQAFSFSEGMSRRDPSFQHERGRARAEASKILSKTHRKLYAVLKDRGMLLPLAQQDETMFDEERFLRESDL